MDIEKFMNELDADIHITKIPCLSEKWEVIIDCYTAMDENLTRAIMTAATLYREGCRETA